MSSPNSPFNPVDRAPKPGPVIRSDIVDVYVFRRRAADAVGPPAEFLQMRRAQGALVGTWHPVMGHIDDNELAPVTALRELGEETGYGPRGAGDEARKLLGFWQLEKLNTYYLASHNSIVMSPGFAAEVAPDSDPVLDESHDAFRWVAVDRVDRNFLWPGQRDAIAHIMRDIVAADSLIREQLVIDPSQA